jgi:hypothetical protein
VGALQPDYSTVVGIRWSTVSQCFLCRQSTPGHLCPRSRDKDVVVALAKTYNSRTGSHVHGRHCFCNTTLCWTVRVFTSKLNQVRPFGSPLMSPLLYMSIFGWKSIISRCHLGLHYRRDPYLPAPFRTQDSGQRLFVCVK